MISIKSFSFFSKGVLQRKGWKLIPVIKSTKPCSNGLKGQDPKMFLSVVCWSKKRHYILPKNWPSKIFNHQIAGRTNGRKGLVYFFLFQTLLQYNYSNSRSFSLRISMNFSSAVNKNQYGTFTLNPPFWLIALPWTVFWYLFSLAAFRK